MKSLIRPLILFGFTIAALVGCGDRLLLDDPRDLDIQVASPVFSVPAGIHNADFRVAITCATPGAEIHYTVDGSAPTDRAPRFSGSDPLTISGNGTTRTIRAIAVKPRLRNSEVVTATYTVSYGGLGVPRFSPIEGVYSSDQAITISSDDSGAVIHYTTDGSTPTAASPVYSSAIPLAGDGATLTLSAISCKSGMLDSSPVIAVYGIDYSRTSTPNFSPAAGTYDVDKTVTITCDTPGAQIYYTVDGVTEPSASSALYGSSISVSGDRTVKTIKAKAFSSGMKDSTASSATYTIEYPVAAPVISPGSFATRENVTVTITQTRAGATLYYTTDGSDPRTSATSVVYAGPFTLPRRPESTTSIKTATKLSGWSDSPVASTSYTFLAPKLFIGLSGGGGILVSENKGVTWTNTSCPTAYGILNLQSTGASNIYAGFALGLYVSYDGGDGWDVQNTADGLSGGGVSGCAVVPENDGLGRHIRDTVYAYTLNGGLYTRTLNVQTDTWETSWSMVAAKSSLGGTYAQSILAEGSNIFMATNSGVWRRVGGSWSSSLPGATTAENNCRTITRFGRFLIVGTNSGVFSSTDNGASWTKGQFLQGGGLIATTGFILFSSSDGTYAYAGDYVGVDDGGVTPTWRSFGNWFSATNQEFQTGSPNQNEGVIYGRGVAVNECGVFVTGSYTAMKLSGQDWYSGGSIGTSYVVWGIAAP